MIRTTLIALLLAGGVLAEDAPYAAVVGTWDVKTNLNGRTMPAVLELSVGKDGKLAGKWKSMNGTVPLGEVKFAAGVLTFVRKTQGREIGFKATIAEGKLTGSHTVGQREIPASGRKLSAAELNDPAKEFERNSMRAAPRDAFPVLDDPKMTTAADAKLEDDEFVIGVVVGDEAKAYSVRVMGRHELVNDSCGGDPIAVSW